jgi:putative MATE family efflux protein
MSDKSNYNFCNNKISLFSLTWPIFIELAMHCITLSLNLFLVGQVSVNLVAALTVGNQVFELCMILFNFIGIGTTVVISQLLGARNYSQLSTVIHMGLCVNFVIGFIISIIIILFDKSIMHIMNMPIAILNDGHRYLLIITLALIPEALNFVLISILRAFGYTKHAMVVSMIINVITFVGNILLLFGLYGIPKFGVAGVACATVVGRIIGTILLLYIVITKTHIKIYIRNLFSFSYPLLKRMLHIGLPGAGENLSWHMQFMVVTSFIAYFGEIPLATHGLYFQICIFIMLFAQSLAMSTEIIVAHHVGAFKLRYAYSQLLRSLKIGFVITLIIALGNAFVFGKPLLSLFTDSNEVLVMATNLFYLSIIMEPGRIFNIIVINSLRATGDAQFPMWMAIISMWGISIPVGYFLGVYMNYGLIGIWIGMACDEWFRGISMYIRWHTRIWEKKIVQLKKEELTKHLI